MVKLPAALAVAVLMPGLPLLAAAAELSGGGLRLQPAAPAAAVQAEADPLRLTGLVGQPVTARSDGGGRFLRGGFVTPLGAAPLDAIFADGFEEIPP